MYFVCIYNNFDKRLTPLFYLFYDFSPLKKNDNSHMTRSIIRLHWYNLQIDTKNLKWQEAIRTTIGETYFLFFRLNNDETIQCTAPEV